MEAAIQKSSLENVFWKYATNIQENTHAEVQVVSIKLQSNFIEPSPRYGCSPVNLLHIFRIRFLKNTSGRLLLYLWKELFYFFLVLSKVGLNYDDPVIIADIQLPFHSLDLS